MITQQDILQATAYINDIDIYTVGALVESFKVSGTAITNTAYQGLDSTDFNVLSTTRGMRVITLNLFYKATTKRGLALKKAKIDNLIGNGKIDLALPDGFHYAAFLTSAGEEQSLGVEGNELIALCTYTLQGIRHDALETLDIKSGIAFICKSLIPETDVRISFKNYGFPAFTIAGVDFTSPGADDLVVIDGINKRILINGAPFTSGVSFVKFPKLIPGENQIIALIGGLEVYLDLTVEYYPTY